MGVVLLLLVIIFEAGILSPSFRLVLQWWIEELSVQLEVFKPAEFHSISFPPGDSFSSSPLTPHGPSENCVQPETGRALLQVRPACAAADAKLCISAWEVVRGVGL